MDPRHPVLFPLDVDTYPVVREPATDVAPNRRRQVHAGYDKRIWRCGEAQWCFGGMNSLWCWPSTSRPNWLVAQARELFVSDPVALQSISANDTSVWQLPSEVLA